MTKDYLPTPIYKFSEIEKVNVYEPAEDSFLLLDALENEKDFILELKPSIVLEIGSGSGIVMTFLIKNFNLTTTFFLASDINSVACTATQNTFICNNVSMSNSDIVRDDLAQSLLPHLKNQIDLIFFNPPYVATENEESSSMISKAWNGGTDGNFIIDKSIIVINQLLSTKGVAYIILVNENQPSLFIYKIKSRYNLNGKIIMQRRALNEHLFVIKCFK